MNAKKQPLRTLELITVFYGKQCTYNPQLVKKDKKKISKNLVTSWRRSEHYSRRDGTSCREIPIDMGYPNQTLHFLRRYNNSGRAGHPSQKPVDLLEYLIKTYTNEGETVFDGFEGSGSTGVAAKNLNRNFIGIEQDEEYFKIASERVKGLGVYPADMYVFA
jgi:site-specific DNA-methyltransferase (adenine-specific)